MQEILESESIKIEPIDKNNMLNHNITSQQNNKCLLF